MTEFNITRGRDIALSVDGEPLCGVTHFTAVSRFRTHEICEYLSAQPFDTVSEGESHELVVTILSLFAGTIPQNSGFTLCVDDGDTAYLYEGCAVVKAEKDARGDKAVEDRFTFSAKKMTKRRTNNAG